MDPPQTQRAAVLMLNDDLVEVVAEWCGPPVCFRLAGVCRAWHRALADVFVVLRPVVPNDGRKVPIEWNWWSMFAQTSLLSPGTSLPGPVPSTARHAVFDLDAVDGFIPLLVTRFNGARLRSLVVRRTKPVISPATFNTSNMFNVLVRTLGDTDALHTVSHLCVDLAARSVELKGWDWMALGVFLRQTRGVRCVDLRLGRRVDHGAVCGVLRSCPADLRCLRLDLRGAAVASELASQLCADADAGLPRRLVDLRVDVGRCHAPDFVRDLLGGDRLRRWSSSSPVLARCPALERLEVRLSDDRYCSDIVNDAAAIAALQGSAAVLRRSAKDDRSRLRALTVDCGAMGEEWSYGYWVGKCVEDLAAAVDEWADALEESAGGAGGKAPPALQRLTVGLHGVTSSRATATAVEQRLVPAMGRAVRAHGAVRVELDLRRANVDVPCTAGGRNDIRRIFELASARRCVAQAVANAIGAGVVCPLDGTLTAAAAAAAGAPAAAPVFMSVGRCDPPAKRRRHK